MTQLRQHGYELQVKAVFDAPTIAELARLLAAKQSAQAIDVEQGKLEGTFALLPIQAWFFEQDLAAAHHWNQAFTLQLPQGMTYDALQDALIALAAQHDMLRVRFTTDGVQTYTDTSTQGPLATCDVSALDNLNKRDNQALKDALTAYQSHFDVYTGPLWQPVWLTGYADGRSRLFLALHHLIIDAVSWRIIVTDLHTLLTGGTLGKKTSSYRQWVNAMQDDAQRADAERHYWETVMADHTPLPIAAPADTSNGKSEQWIRFDKPFTQQLLQQANAGFNTDTHDLLLSALAQALAISLSTPVNHITLEGHGRETLDERLDISHTVGWFTSMYPLRLQAQATLADTIIHTKEMLRQIPRKGFGFSALRQAGRVGSTLPSISFNYLGQLNRDTHDDWQLVSEETGLQSSPHNTPHTQIDINGGVRDGRLQFHVGSTLPPDMTSAILTAFDDALRDTVAEALRQTTPVMTPSDHGQYTLSIDNLRHLEARYRPENIEAIYPASSLQQGFIYHHLSQPDDDAYRIQVLLDYRQTLDVAAFIEAWRHTTLQFPVLRTAFDWSDGLWQITTR